MAKSKPQAKVRVALIGAGGFMGAHAARLRSHSDVQLVAVCDVNEKTCHAFIDKHLKDSPQKPPVFTDLAAMYAAAKPDAVFIATPHTLHFAHGVQALEAGCHVYMEKPMVTSAGDAYALAAKVEKSKKTLVIGYNTPCTPEFFYLRETIRNQSLGRLEMVCGCISQDWLRFTRGLWRQDPALSGGGQAYDSGAHLLNSLCWSVESDVAEVFAFVDNHGAKVDINSTLNIRFASGVMAAIAIGGNCPAHVDYTGHTSFIFDGGRIDIDAWCGSWIHVWKGDRRVKYPPITGEAQTPDDNFIDAILGRAEPRTSPRNGIVQSQLMDAIYESARTGMPAKPKKR